MTLHISLFSMTTVLRRLSPPARRTGESRQSAELEDEHWADDGENIGGDVDKAAKAVDNIEGYSKLTNGHAGAGDENFPTAEFISVRTKQGGRKVEFGKKAVATT